MLDARGVGYRIDDRWLVRDVDLRVERGSIWAIAGPNGAGKSTLLRIVSGELARTTGRVIVDGCDIDDVDAGSLARQRALLAQTRRIELPFTSWDIAMLGRFPYLNGARETVRDRNIVGAALARTGASDLAQRNVMTLSGGERGRVDLARVLAQEPVLLLLDEPTHHLDPRYQIEALELCRTLADDGRAVVLVLHDLNLAAMYADGLLLMKDGRAMAAGRPADVLTETCIAEVFDIECRIWTHPTGCPWVVPCPRRERSLA